MIVRCCTTGEWTTGQRLDVSLVRFSSNLYAVMGSLLEGCSCRGKRTDERLDTVE
jgi:hypothetical protein